MNKNNTHHIRTAMKLVVVLSMLSIMLTSCAQEPINEGGFTPVDNVQTNPIDDDSDKVVVYFFWGDGCPHCTVQKPFMEGLQAKYDGVEVKMFETWKNPQNAKLFSEIAQKYGTTARGVPTTFIHDQFWVGYNSRMGEEMEALIVHCLSAECDNPGTK